MELNREQIKKALECCHSHSYRNCPKCPYNEDTEKTCFMRLMEDALSLIKELTEKEKKSDSEYDQAIKRGYELGAVNYVKSFAERLKAEIEQTPNANEHFIKAWKSKIDQIAK